MSDIEGRFTWYDFMAADIPAAIEFYTKLFGWTAEAWEGPKPYTMFKNGDRVLGGVMELPEEATKMGAPPNWVAYIGTPDIAATVAAATEAGAQVRVPAFAIPEVGRIAFLADPLGAMFAVFAPAGDMPDPGPPQVGEVDWAENGTADYARAFDFYAPLFGWTVSQDVEMDMGEHTQIYRIFKGAGRPLGGLYTIMEGMPMPPHWLYYFRVAGLEAKLALVKELGGRVLNGPMEVPGGDRTAQCMDAQGGMFGLHEAKEDRQ